MAWRPPFLPNLIKHGAGVQAKNVPRFFCCNILCRYPQDVWALQQHLAQTYGVRYKSRKSYDALLKKAGMSWKKTQHTHPDADEQQVAEKRVEIQKKRAKRSASDCPKADRCADGG
jgi:hypothetical protein